MRRHPLWHNLMRSRSSEEDARHLLKQTPIFADLSRRELDAIERIVYHREYETGQTIFHQGEPGVCMYIVKKGQVAIVQHPSNMVLAELVKGDFFGEITLLNETPRSASATTTARTELLAIPQSDLMSLLTRNTRLGVKVLLPLARITSQRLMRINDDMEQLHLQHEALLNPSPQANDTNGASSRSTAGTTLE